MHRLADSLQDGGEGGNGLFNQEDEADVCRAAELVRQISYFCFWLSEFCCFFSVCVF